MPIQTIEDAVIDAVGTVTCAGARASDWVEGLLADVGLSTPSIQRAVDLFRAGQCGDRPENLSPVGSPPPFTGGQCTNLNYRLEVDVTYGARGNPASAVPATVVRVSDPGAISSIMLVEISGFENAGLQVTNGNGQALFPPPFANFAASQYFSIEDIRVTVVGGAPDTCGNLPEQVNPISQHTEVVQLEYPDKDNVPVILPNVPIDFYAPCINLDGVRIPFEVTTPIGKICGKIGIRPSVTSYVDFDIDIDTCPSARQDLGYTDEPMERFFSKDAPVGNVSPSDQEFVGVESGSFDPETQEPIVAVKIVSGRQTPSLWPKETVMFKEPSSPTPDLIVPDIGVYRFLLVLEQEGSVEYAWSAPERIQSVQQIATLPEGQGAADFEVNYRPGWEGGYTAYRRKSCCEACKSADPNAIVDNLDRCLID